MCQINFYCGAKISILMAISLPYNMKGELQIMNKIMKTLIHQMFTKFTETFDRVKNQPGNSEWQSATELCGKAHGKSWQEVLLVKHLLVSFSVPTLSH